MGATKYTKEQIDFLFEQRRKGRPLSETTKLFNQKKGWHQAAEGSLFQIIRRHRARYEGEVKNPTGQKKQDNKRNEILNAFLKWVEVHKFIPSVVAFCKDAKFSRAALTVAFKTFDHLEEEARKARPDLFKQVIDETSFTDAKYRDLKRSVEGHQRFFVTTAVTGCVPHEKGMAAIQTYCDQNDAKLLVILVSDPANNKPKKYKFSAHPDLPSDGIVFRDLVLNENLKLSSIKLQAKQINPLTGLRALAQHNSCILGSPKQVLEPVSSSNKLGIPHHLMTTGAITLPEYGTKSYIAERTAYLANDAHVLGGIIVEIKDQKIFFYRHVQINPKTGAFSDLNKQYHPGGRVDTITAELIQAPDWHTGSVNPEFKSALHDMVEALAPKYLTHEDFFDGISINPFERRNVAQRAKRSISGRIKSLEQELELCSQELQELSGWNIKKLVIKYGNHDDFLKRWLAQAEYADDPLNHYMGVCLAKGMLEGTPPFEYAMTEMFPFKGVNKIKFLSVRDSFKVNGIENAVHGHIGAGGKRSPSVKALEVYGLCNVGHLHAPGILKGVFRVGTATHLLLDYNDGASNWSNTFLIQHRDGSRQLVTVIEGESHLSD